MDNVIILKSMISTSELSLHLLEYEKNDPEKGDYLHFRAEAKSKGFAGWSEFWLSKTRLEGFIFEVDQFYKKLDSTPLLECGWDDDVYFSLEFFPYDRLGHLGSRITLANRKSSRETRMHRAFIEFELEPGHILELIKRFRNLLLIAERDNP